MFKSLLIAVALIFTTVSTWAAETTDDVSLNPLMQFDGGTEVVCANYASRCSIGMSSMTCGAKQYADGGCSVECPERFNLPVCVAAKCGFNSDYYPSSCSCR